MPNWKGHHRPKVKSSTVALISVPKKLGFMIGDWRNGISTVRRVMAASQEEKYGNESPEYHMDYDDGAEEISYRRMFGDSI